MPDILILEAAQRAGLEGNSDVFSAEKTRIPGSRSEAATAAERGDQGPVVFLGVTIFISMPRIKEFLGIDQQRLGRGKYILVNLITAILCIVLIKAENYLPMQGSSIYLSSFVILLVFVLALWIFLGITVSRLRDVNHSVWWTLAIFFPVVSLVLIIYLCLKKGKSSLVKV